MTDKPNPPDPSGRRKRRPWQKSPEVELLEAQLFPEGFITRHEANAIVAMAFRNGPIEDLHAGKWSPLLTDSELSRITDEEIKALMINACQQMEKLLKLKEADPDAYYQKMMTYNHRYCRRWER